MNHTKVNESTCTAAFLVSESNLVMILTTLENSIALVVLFTVSTRSNFNTHFLIRLLAINDLVSALLILLSASIMKATCPQFANSVACDLLGWLAMSAYCYSLHIICIMNVERYFMVCHPVIHRNHFTKKLCIVLLLIGIVITFGLLALPLMDIGGPYLLYDDNGICGFDLAPRGHLQQKILIAYCGCQGSVWVTLTILSNIAISKKLNIKIAATADNAENVNSKQAKWKQFSAVTKVVAVVNSVMTFPFYVSIHEIFCVTITTLFCVNIHEIFHIIATTILYV